MIRTSPYQHSRTSEYEFMYNECSSLTLQDGMIVLPTQRTEDAKVIRQLGVESERKILRKKVEEAENDAYKRAADAVAGISADVIWTEANTEKTAVFGVRSTPPNLTCHEPL